MSSDNVLENLEFIKTILERTKKDFIYNGLDYIIWGILIFFGMIGSYIFFAFDIKEETAYIWILAIAIGWLYSFLRSRKEKRESKTFFLFKVVGYLWFSLGIAMTIIGFIGTYSGAVVPMGINPVLSVMLGCGYYMTGKILDSKWFSLLSIGWFVGGILMFFVRSSEQFLIMAFLMLAFQITPGLILYFNYKKFLVENHERV